MRILKTEKMEYKNIEQGKIATCIKTCKMDVSSSQYAGIVAFTKGKDYQCRTDGYLIDDLEQQHGVFGDDGFFNKHFKIKNSKVENKKMTAQETITKLNENRYAFIVKLIEKYEAEIKTIEEVANFTTSTLEIKYYMGKASYYLDFISDLKQLQQNTGY